MQFTNKEAVVDVLPEADQFTSTARTAALEKKVESLKKELADLSNDAAAVAAAAVRFYQLQRKRALRRLLNGARAELAGHALSDEERGQSWNDTLDKMEDFKGLSKEAALLTKFGQDPPWWHSGIVVDSCDYYVWTIAEAVTEATKNRDLYAELFTFVYQMDAAELLASLDDDE